MWSDEVVLAGKLGLVLANAIASRDWLVTPMGRHASRRLLTGVLRFPAMHTLDLRSAKLSFRSPTITATRAAWQQGSLACR